MQMRDVKLGTWACTADDDVVEVAWSQKMVKFHPLEKNPSTNAGNKHEDYPALSWNYENIAKIELDYGRRLIRLRGQGRFGALGLGNDANRPTPVHIRALVAAPVRQMACGERARGGA